MPGDTAHPDRRTRAVVGGLARALEPRLPALTAELTALFRELMPGLPADDPVSELMAASTAANLGAVHDMLVHDIPPRQATVPVAAAEYARRLAQRDVPLALLLRAYRLGEERFLQWWLNGPGIPALDAPTLLATTREVTTLVAGYIDRVCDELSVIHTAETARWRQRADAARAAQVRAVLEDESVDLATAEAMIGHRMSGGHTAAVVWAEPGSPAAARSVDSATAVLATGGGARPFAVAADTHTVWAWLPGVAPPVEDLDAALRERPWLRVALGEPGRGLAGFRSSHQEALRARAVAEIGGGQRLTTFSAVAVPALLADDLHALRTWVHRVLGGLARDDEATGRLRETARVFLGCGGSYADAAARLHLHRNTVLYRVQQAEQVRGRPFGDGRLDVEVALAACHRLGRGLLGTPREEPATAPPAPRRL